MARKILVIEDDKLLRKVIKRKLFSENYEVLEAIDGETGLRIAREEKIDLILLDLVLPGLDGFEILDQLKKDPNSSKVPVIILSNLGAREDIKKGMAKGAVDYLVKAHLNPSEIIERIESVISKKS